MIRSLVLALALAAGPALALDPSELLPDPAEEARARAITAELRCVVCQGQAIDESNAEIARDLRMVVREQVAAGRSDSEIYDFLVERYGEFVLYRPPFSLQNAALWLAGPAFLLLGGAIGFAFVRRRATNAPVGAPRLSHEESERLARLLDD
jgi:cytochrome c-type biogenesis protein CcmH